MNNKYYTPELSEFHVGFRYEFKTLDGWVNKTVSWNDFPSYAGDYIGESLKEGVRVKHLDRKDIEELKWGFKGAVDRLLASNTEYFWGDGGTGSIIYNYTTLKAVITLRDEVEKEDFTVFVGKIKNFNELQKVMEQIKIG